MDDDSLDVQARLERVRQGDQAAARQLVEHLYPLVIKIVLTKLPRRESEDDLTQEIFLKMFSILDQYWEIFLVQVFFLFGKPQQVYPARQ